MRIIINGQVHTVRDKAELKVVISEIRSGR